MTVPRFILAGAATGTLFFCIWSLLKLHLQGAPVNIVYAVPVILVFVCCAIGLSFKRTRDA